MSLQIVGSCSQITRNIVLQLAKNSQYKSISISDLLPQYYLHNRFYRLKRELAEANVSTQVTLNKIIQPHTLYQQINKADDVLFVTHDYYQNVTSKTKLMNLVAQYAKNKSHLFFATPVQYDHFGFDNPEQNYVKAQNQVRQTNPNSTFIRSDVQNRTQLFSCLKSHKNFSFASRVVNAKRYAEIVAQNMQNRTQGKIICVRGEKQMKTEEVDLQKNLDVSDWEHAWPNIVDLARKYNGSIGANSDLVSTTI